ncbi:MAG: hypothetical protein K2X27_14155 [Candidatus Obscuribacterales bacterium]|nr:hypothetical protein [Candidatus Obscuribacterales bacterium]
MRSILTKALLSASMLPFLLQSGAIQETLAAEETAVLRGSASMDDLGMQIVKKEIELLSLNSDFRNHYMQGNKWKKRRLKLYEMAAGGVANAGDITLISQFWHYYRNPGAGLKHKGSLESGAITVMVAYLSLGGLYAAEGLNDLFQDFRSARKGWSSKSVLQKAETLKNEIDAAISARKIALQNDNSSPDEKRMLEQENKVLQDCRDLSLLEFSKLYIDARKKRIARDVTTVGTIAVCATGAFPGALAVTRGIQEVNLKMIGGGGIGFLISGATLAGAPLLIHGGAAAGGAWTKHNLSKTLGEIQCKVASNLESDTASLLAMKTDTASSSQLSSRMNAYKSMPSLFAERQDFLEAEHRKNKRDTIEDFITYAIEGGPQIAWGTLVARAGYRYNRNASKAFKLIAEGATVNEVAWGSWLLNKTQGSIRDELYNLKHRFDSTSGAFGKDNKSLVQLKLLGASANLGNAQ